MTQIKADQPVYETTASALREKRKLRRHFRRFDIFFYLICTVVTIDTIGAVASNGAQGFTWLIFLAVFFFLPYALSIAELGSAFPQEGGPYVWTRLAFGRPLAAVNSVIYWISNPIWVGGSLTIVSFAAIEEFFGPVGGGWKYVYAVAFIWFTIGTAIVSLQYGKWVPTLGAWARGAVLAFFVISVIVYAAKHGVHGFGGHAFLPTYAIFIAVVPVLIFNYAGLEVPSAAAQEMTNPRRDVPFSILWSGAATVLAYGIPILSILIVLPASAVSGLTGFLDAIKAVFTVYGGHVSADGTATLSGAGLILGRVGAVVFIFALASAGATWIMGADRAEAVASVDGGGPRHWEAAFGTIPQDSAVIMWTGFEDRWDDPAAYLNADRAGRPHYPGFSAEAVGWLVEHRSIGALGIDTMGIDPGADTTFRANQLLLQDHRIHLENLAGLSQMPPAGGWIITGGIRIRAGSGSPATVFGLIP